MNHKKVALMIIRRLPVHVEYTNDTYINKQIRKYTKKQTDFNSVKEYINSYRRRYKCGLQSKTF